MGRRETNRWPGTVCSGLERAVGHRGRIDEQVSDESVERIAFFGGRDGDTKHALAEGGAFVELRLVSTTIFSSKLDTYVSASQNRNMQIVSAGDPLRWPLWHEATCWAHSRLPQLTIETRVSESNCRVQQSLGCIVSIFSHSDETENTLRTELSASIRRKMGPLCIQSSEREWNTASQAHHTSKPAVQSC